ncbi:aly/REF export factor 2 [Drosophila rhopaloa]|uniref:Aly/REF export factor 2 n=1 Tax=Drosophila rhopaloa TaxID=1041015 RepID=A0A6P4FBP8_DRORH|nr:aly/REF export factor 2 [Drosophila rhopaloa]
MNKIEMSLDDIIKLNRIEKEEARGDYGRVCRPGGHGGGKGSIRNPAPGSGGKGILKSRGETGRIQKSKYTRGKVVSGEYVPTRLMVCNLDFSVSDMDIIELFSDIGALQKANVHYNSFGRSLGTAEVVFKYRNHAMKAIRQFQGVRLDGRPMTIYRATTASNADCSPFKPRPFRTGPFKSGPIKSGPFKRDQFKSRSSTRHNYKRVGSCGSASWGKFRSESNYKKESKEVRARTYPESSSSWLPNWTRRSPSINYI